MIGRNFIENNFRTQCKKFRLKIRYRETDKKKQNDFTRYDVNDRVYSKSKSIQLRTDLAKVEVIQILTLS